MQRGQTVATSDVPPVRIPGVAAADHQAARLSFARIYKSYPAANGQDLVVLDDVSLELGAGNFTSVVGPSGCGKSTLLRIAVRSVRADAGEVCLQDTQQYEPGRDIVMMYQNYGLFPWQTVLRNVAFGLRMRKDRQADEKARAYLDKVGLARVADYYPHQLSGGMQQRVGLARALACEPRVLLMDEPFAAVDAHTREELQEMLLELWQQQTMTIMFVTHDIGEALYLGDRVVVMGRDPGRVVKDITVHLGRPRGSETRVSDDFVAYERAVREALQW